MEAAARRPSSLGSQVVSLIAGRWREGGLAPDHFLDRFSTVSRRNGFVSPSIKQELGSSVQKQMISAVEKTIQRKSDREKDG